MYRAIRSNLAIVIAFLALFVAMGGASHAADAVAVITGRDVKDSSLTSADVKNGSLLKADFKAGQLPRGLQGAAGAPGAQGPAGDRGPAGAGDPASFYDRAQSDSRFLGITAKAADADTVDGRDASSFAGRPQTSTAGFTELSQYSSCDVGSVTPTVTVDVGPSGLVAVYAEAVVRTGTLTNSIDVFLYEATDSPSCGDQILRSTVDTNVVRRTGPGLTSGTVVHGSWLIFRATPGVRTYKLVYGAQPNYTATTTLPSLDKQFLAVLPL